MRRHGTLAHIFANLTTAVMCGQREDNHTFPHTHHIYVMMAEGLLRGMATGVKDREKRTKGKRGERDRGWEWKIKEVKGERYEMGKEERDIIVQSNMPKQIYPLAFKATAKL